MIPQIQQLWDYIGTAWTDFQDKELIENFWLALASGNQYIYNHVANTQFSRTIDLMYPTYDYGPETFVIVYSGTSTEINVTPVVETTEQILNGGFETNTSGWIMNYGRGNTARSNTQAHTGSWSIKLYSQDGEALYRFGGSQYPSSTATAWFYIVTNGFPINAGDIAIDLIDKDDNVIATVAADPTIVNSWQKVTLYSQKGDARGFIVRNSSMGSDAWVDDVSMKRAGVFEYPLPPYTYSLPTITYRYMYNGVLQTGTYTQGTDYLLSADMDNLIWINPIITKDLRFPSTGVIVGTADHLYRINTVLCEVWAKQCGFNILTHLPRYNSFGQNKYKHLKNMIWSLDYYQNLSPSIYTLKNAYGIARGLPFAYESGIMSYSIVGGLYNVTIGGDTFIFPSGLRPGLTGYYDKFEILASGLDLYDYATSPALVNAYTNPYTRRSTLIYKESPAISGISFSQDFLDTYVKKIVPEQIQYLII